MMLDYGHGDGFKTAPAKIRWVSCSDAERLSTLHANNRRNMAQTFRVVLQVFKRMQNSRKRHYSWHHLLLYNGNNRIIS